MHTTTPPHNRLVAYLTLFLCACAAHAQPLARTALSARQVYLGDEFRFQISVEGVAADDAAELVLPPGLTVVSARTSVQRAQYILDGVSQESLLTYCIYTLIATEEGRLAIPDQVVQLGNTQARIPRTPITVVQPQTIDGFDLNFDLPDRPLYVGEIVPARVEWSFTNGAVADPTFAASQLPSSFEVLPNASPPGATPGTLFELAFADTTVAGVHTTDGRTSTLAFNLLLRPTAPGDATLGPIAATFTVRTASGSIRAISRSPVRTREVRPLPPGAPPSFNGLVGDYTITATASDTAVNVGDPIRIECTVRARAGVLSARPVPRFADPDTTELIFSPDGWNHEVDLANIAARYTTTVRPGSPDVTAIPPIEITFFDPQLGEYRTARTQPIPIEARAVREVTAGDARIAGTTQQDPLRSGPPGVWAEDRGPSLLEPQPAPGPFGTAWPIWAAAFSAAPCLALLATLARRGAATDPVIRARKRALRDARRAHARGDAATAARTLLAALQEGSPDSITAADADRANLTPQHAGDLRALLAANESERFAGTTKPAAPDASAAIRELEHALRSRA